MIGRDPTSDQDPENGPKRSSDPRRRVREQRVQEQRARPGPDRDQDPTTDQRRHGHGHGHGHEIFGRIVTPGGVVHGALRVEGDRIVEITETDATAPDRDHDGSGDGTGTGTGWIVPGFVDMHVHGGGSHTFTTGDADSARAAAAFHLRHGTTTLLASLVSSPPDLMLAATRAFVPLIEAGVLAGIHYEGPYLSVACRGAQNPAFLRDPSIAELRALLEAGTGTGARMMTLAPELPGALDAIGYLVGHGAVVAIGHTDATYEQVLAAVTAGATVGTHVFNGMRPPHHRTPGPVFALLGAPGVTCEFVADGVHLHDGTLAFATRSVGTGRAALITDAIDATGIADGHYDLGGQRVSVSGGVARLVTADGSPGAIAGSTLTMDAAVRRAVRVGHSIIDASRMASSTPARALGLDREVGALVPGLRADLVVLDADLVVTRVMRGGAWI